MVLYKSILKTTIKRFFAILVLSYFFLPTSAAAEGVPIGPCGQSTGLDTRFQNLCDNANTPVGTVVGNVITIILVIAVVLAVGFLIWGGIKWITSGGDKTAVDTARKTIIAAIVGLILTFLTFFILSFVLSLFDINFTKLELTPVNVPVSKAELTEKCKAQVDGPSCGQVAGCYWSGSACLIKPH